MALNETLHTTDINKHVPRYTPEQVAKRRELVATVSKGIGITALSAAAAFGGLKAYEAGNTWEEVGETSVSIERGDTPIGAVAEGRDEIAEANNIDVDKIGDTIPAGQHAAAELPSDQPGETVVVRVEKNGFNNYRVTADGDGIEDN